MADKFSHIHLHTEYSLLDGLTKIKKLTNRVKEMGMSSVAMTDHGVMYGAVEFYKQALKDGVKPIVGMEAYTTTIDHTLRPERSKLETFHLLLLAKDEEGYKNLMKITSIAHLEGYYYRPRINNEVLAKYSKGIIATSACPAGELANHLIDGDMEGARKTVKWFKDVFGEDYYLEVQRHNYHLHIDPTSPAEIQAEQRKMTDYERIINGGVLDLSKEFNVPIVATNDAHYLNKEDASAQDVLVCVSTGKQVSETKRIRFIDTPEYYVKSPEEMEELFPDMPEALANTVKVADKCNLEITTLGKWFFPKYEVPTGEPAEDYLRKLANERLPEKIPNFDTVTKERLDYELGIIIQKGYAPYFLIVMSMVNWANSQGIITNTRGSAAGSLVSFVLGITTVDPMKYYLPFERFLNPYRPTPPDIDFDVSDVRRDDIIHYIADTYGHEKVAQICTFGRMLARASARDVARVLGYPYATGDRLSKLIPPPKQGFPIDVTKALVANPELKALYDSDRDAKKILDLARQVEGSARHISIHAAGVVVAPSDIREFSPIQNDEPGGSKIVTQYEFHACEEVGLIKFDILGIRNLSILGDAVKNVEQTHGIKVDLNKIPLDDLKTFEMLGRGETMGVFQLSGGGMTKYLMDLKPTRIEDLMAMVALYRPGPMAVIPEYIERKQNPGKVRFLDPRMEKFLAASYGLIVYQDDLLFCAIDLAGYSWEEADKFRKAVGKKIPEEMAAQKEKFQSGIVANGQTIQFAETLWTLFEPFQSYGFNKAHAASYGMVAYQTGYMKANYPVEYMAALMTAESGDIEKISAAINECRRMEIVVLAPDINESFVGFTIVKNEESLNNQAIRFGLSAIKNVGKAAIEVIIEARKDGLFTSFVDFCQRVDARKVNKKVVESLIKVGALSSFGNRASLIESLEEIRNKTKQRDNGNQIGLFGEEEEELAKAATVSITHTYNQLPEYNEDTLVSLERELMGFSLSAPPIHEMISELSPYKTHRIDEVTMEHLPKPKDLVKIAAVISEVRVVITKKSSAEMAFVKVDDGTGTLDVVVFPKLYAQTRLMWIEQKPVLLTGKIDTRDDKPNMLVDTIETIESVKGTQGTLKISIPDGTETNTLKQLKEILMSHPGEQKVTLSFEGVIRREVQVPFGVTWDQDLSRKIAVALEMDRLAN